MKEFLMVPSAVWRNSVLVIRNAWTFTPSAFRARWGLSALRSSMVIRKRSMSDFCQTVSCARLPQRTAARTERSFSTSPIRAASALSNLLFVGEGKSACPPYFGGAGGS